MGSVFIEYSHRNKGFTMKVVVPILVCAIALAAVASAKPRLGEEERAKKPGKPGGKPGKPENLATEAAAMENLKNQEMEVESLENLVSLAWKENRAWEERVSV